MRLADLVFFLSGAAALVYQVAWVRLLSRLTGSDSVGIALVLAVFMGGMGAGAWFLARPVARTRDARRTFAALGLAMGLWAAASPHLLERLDPVTSGAGRAGVALLVLLVPTSLMGASFPLMGRLLIASDAAAGRGTSRFYGANTLGAAFGAVAGSFALFPLLGLSLGLLAGAALDFAAAGLALLLPPVAAGAGSAAAEPAPDGGAGLRPAGPLAMTFLFGASSLALEVLLSRTLVTVTGASVYAFAIVLAVFLLGIGLGGRQAQTLVDGPGAALRLARRCALWTPVAGFAGLLALRWQLGEDDLFGSLANRMPDGAPTAVLWASHALFAGLALFPPALGFGLALPACATLAVADRGRASREVALGRMYACNTAGAMLGSLAAAFVLLPWLGPRAGTAVAYGLALAALVASARRRDAGENDRLGARSAVPLAVAVVLGALVLRPAAPGAGVAGAAGAAGERVVLHEVGRDSTVSVVDAPAIESGPGVRALRVNGKVVATTAPVDLRLQRLLGALPALVGEPPRSALVIGLGTGMTAGALLDFPSLERLVVFEISSAVVRGAAEFADWNAGVLDDPRAEVRIADGRHALAVSDERFDVVTADPIHPWTRGSSDLYSLEHFREMARHLTPGGVASQWLPLYQLSTEDVRTVVATWCAAFEHASAWLTAYDLVLVGSLEPPARAAELSAAPFPPRVDAALSAAGVHGPLELAALAVADDAALRELAGDARPMVLDHPRLEFRAPLSYLLGYSEEVLRWAAASPVDGLPPAARGRAREVRALLGAFLEELDGGVSSAAERYGRALVALEPLVPGRAGGD